MTATFDEQTQFVDSAGVPVVGGSVYFGTAGADPVLNPISIFSDRELTVSLTNPQTTDSNGRVTNKVWLDGKYSLELQDSSGVQLYQELDNGTTSSSTSILSLSSVSGADTITGSASTTIAAYSDGQQFVFKTASINTGAVTLNVDAVGAKSIVKNFTKAILPGDFAANQEIIVVYNSTSDNFDWVNQKRLSNTFYEGTAVVAAATTDIWATDGDTLHITGTTGITSLGTAPNVGARKTLIFDDIVTLTSSTNLALTGGTDYTTAAGDRLTVYADTVSQFDVMIHRQNGEAVKEAFVDNVLHIQDQQTSGTDAGGTTAAATVTRTLNTILTNKISGASLLSNIITLPAGTFYIEASAPGVDCLGIQTWLYNNSDAVNILVGLSIWTGSSSSAGAISTVRGRFTLAAAKDVLLRFEASGTQATNGLGRAVSTGEGEVYAEVMIWELE